MAALKLDERGILVTCSNCGQTNRLQFARLGDSVRCGKCKQPLSPPAVPLEVQSTADFDRLVSQASIPVVVDFWAEWCGPCRMVAPELAKVAARAAGRFLIVKVDTDALGDLGERYRIRSIPTLAVFANGREVTRTTGARPAGDIEQFILQAAQTVRAGPIS
jgi:thioredoxin 2